MTLEEEFRDKTAWTEDGNTPIVWNLSKTADEQSDEVCEFLLSILK